MVTRALRQGATIALLVFFASLCVTPAVRVVTPTELPARISDQAFWHLVAEMSEPGGFFRSDNLVSNETTFQHVIPELRKRMRTSGVYLGVGPDQNFTYITALRPRIAFIVDVRRQNMLLHLMYKALIEMSPTREEFLARLFSRPPPARDASNDGAEALLSAFAEVEPDPVAFERTRAEIYAHLQQTHGFTLTRSDLAGIDFVFRAFYSAGPDIRYSYGRGAGWQPFPTYRDLMTADDGQGIQRSYIANEEIYESLRDIEQRNLIVPLVGDFGGPKA